MKYETVCGLEVHTELLTQTKIFCGCTTAFGGEVNTHCCEVCTGMPGALPVLNEQVVVLAVRCALLLHCRINRCNRFDRKNYFYPDLPKAYQISQLYCPIGENGWVDIPLENGEHKRIRIKEIHMEEDAGKLLHRNGKTLVDYNRAGVPLLEIVSEPDFASGAEAAQYLDTLRELLRHGGISNCKMQEGSLRADVNVSVRPQGSTVLGTRTEMKNLASLKAVALAVDTEAKRQAALLEKGERIIQQTRRWDENKNASFAMRSKEEAQDYRYFPEPDLPPVVLEEAFIESIKAALPELPQDKKNRYMTAYGLSRYDAEQLCREPSVFGLFENTVALGASPKLTANRILGEILMLLRESGTAADDLSFSPEKLAEIIRLQEDGRVNAETAKRLVAEVYYRGVDPATYVREQKLEISSDLSALEAAAQQVLQAFPKAVQEYRDGKAKSLNFLLGQTMKQLKGKADPSQVKAILIKSLGE